MARRLVLVLASLLCVGCVDSSSSRDRGPSRAAERTPHPAESSPSRKILRSQEPGAAQIANDLVEHMQLVGLRVDCQRAQARFPIKLWEAQSDVDRRMLTAAAARHCNQTSSGSFQMLHATTGKVLATIGALDVELQ